MFSDKPSYVNMYVYIVLLLISIHSKTFYIYTEDDSQSSESSESSKSGHGAGFGGLGGGGGFGG